jgi:hypothetical protein
LSFGAIPSLLPSVVEFLLAIYLTMTKFLLGYHEKENLTKKNDIEELMVDKG